MVGDLQKPDVPTRDLMESSGQWTPAGSPVSREFRGPGGHDRAKANGRSLKMAHNNINSLVWYLAGVASGAAVALLFAPKTGRETRRNIKRNVHKGADAVAEGGREVYEAGHKVVDQAADLLERGRKLVVHG